MSLVCAPATKVTMPSILRLATKHIILKSNTFSIREANRIRTCKGVSFSTCQDSKVQMHYMEMRTISSILDVINIFVVNAHIVCWYCQ